jgi:hypothetical protein
MDAKRQAAAPGFVVLREARDGCWELLGEFARTPGRTARAARTEAILEATDGKARAGEAYAAVLRSEWRVALDWSPPQDDESAR